VVIAVGGDGTANEVAAGLLGTETAMAVVPAGSGNGLARTLGIPLDFKRALAELQGGERRRMDVGFINDLLFLNVAGAGFDADVAQAFHVQAKQGGRRGLLSYTRLSLRMILSYEAPRWKAETDAGGFEGPALIVAVANGRQYGGGARMAPKARLDDGLLDLVILEEAPLIEILWGARRAFIGDLEKLRPYRHLVVRRVTIETAKPAYFHRDGEPEAAVSRLEVRIEPRALAVVVPKKEAHAPDGPFVVAEP
jgi:YegS/Rv2252/BmrU family lipid kinase